MVIKERGQPKQGIFNGKSKQYIKGYCDGYNKAAKNRSEKLAKLQ